MSYFETRVKGQIIRRLLIRAVLIVGDAGCFAGLECKLLRGIVGLLEFPCEIVRGIRDNVGVSSWFSEIRPTLLSDINSDGRIVWVEIEESAMDYGRFPSILVSPLDSSQALMISFTSTWNSSPAITKVKQFLLLQNLKKELNQFDAVIDNGTGTENMLFADDAIFLGEWSVTVISPLAFTSSKEGWVESVVAAKLDVSFLNVLSTILGLKWEVL
ncbi:hypothetical protein Tco_0366590 [Tanacetum coccineum]